MRRIAAVVIAAPLVLAACSSSPSQMAVHGTVTVENVISGQLIHDGSQVTVTDPSGKVLGFTSLSTEESNAEVIVYQFSVKVQDGEQSYGVSVSGLTGTTQFTEAQMKSGPDLCGGNACSGQP